MSSSSQAKGDWDVPQTMVKLFMAGQDDRGQFLVTKSGGRVLQHECARCRVESAGDATLNQPRDAESNRPRDGCRSYHIYAQEIASCRRSMVRFCKELQLRRRRGSLLGETHRTMRLSASTSQHHFFSSDWEVKLAVLGDQLSQSPMDTSSRTALATIMGAGTCGSICYAY